MSGSAIVTNIRVVAVAALAIGQAVPALAQTPAAAHPPVPVGNIGQWFGADAYPPDAIGANEQGRVVAKVTVGVDGKPSACIVIGSSGSFALDSGTCAIVMANVAFDPAVGADGRRVVGYYQLAVRWVMPAPPAASGVPIAFSGSGDATTCIVLIDGGSRRLKPEPCRVFARTRTAGDNRVTVTPDMIEPAAR